MLYTGETGASKFLDRIQRIQADKNKSLGASLIEALKESFSGRTAFARDIDFLRESAATFERIIANFKNASPLKFSRLYGDDFSRSLATILNRASDPIRHSKPKGMPLDSWAPMNYVSSGKELMQFKGNTRTLFAAVLNVIKWPEETSPMLFEELAKLDMEITICQIVRFLNAEQSSAEIGKAIEYYKLTQFGLVDHAVAKATDGTPTPKSGKTILLEKCEEELDRIGAEGTHQAYHNLSVFVYGETAKELNKNVELASNRLSNKRFGVIRERLNMSPSFAALLPGQWSMQSRYELMSIENIADCSPIYTMDEGERTHQFFSKMIFQKPVPKFAVFGNSYGGRVNFAPHVDQVGHMLIIAPTGGGKTTFVNFCLSQFQRYGNVNTFIFDRNLSCKIVTELHEGSHIDIGSKKGKFNPFFAMMDGSVDGQMWVREFLLRRFSEGGFNASAEDRKELDSALDIIAKHFKETGEPIQMSMLATMLPNNLMVELGEWFDGRPYGMFDSPIDDFSISNWTTVEMKEIMSVDRLSRAFIDYAFRKIYVSLDGRPTFIYLEEATFLLNNPNFKDVIDDWLKTFRKKNAFLWLTIQSPQSISNSDISATLLDNIFSFLLLNNEKVEAHRDAYKVNFGFQDHHVDMISKLRPKRDYLLIQGQSARILQTEFSPKALAYLRSEESILSLFDQYKKSADIDWKSKYLAKVAAM